jgi:hypothetical protein
MKVRYFFERLSREQKAALEAVLLEEIDIQGWYAVSVSILMGGEIVIPIQ